MTLALADEDRPYLPRGVRLHHDQTRDRMVLLVPEKAIEVDEIGMAILNRVTGEVSFADLVGDLAVTYNAPVDVIREDVQRFLTSLRARLYLMVNP